MSSVALARPVPLDHRALTDLASDARRLREEAQRRYGEVDLLVAALRDHVRDLQIERDRLRGELDHAANRAHLSAAEWMWRGMKPARSD